MRKWWTPHPPAPDSSSGSTGMAPACDDAASGSHGNRRWHHGTHRPHAVDRSSGSAHDSPACTGRHVAIHGPVACVSWLHERQHAHNRPASAVYTSDATGAASGRAATSSDGVVRPAQHAGTHIGVDAPTHPDRQAHSSLSAGLASCASCDSIRQRGASGEPFGLCPRPVSRANRDTS